MVLVREIQPIHLDADASTRAVAVLCGCACCAALLGAAVRRGSVQNAGAISPVSLRMKLKYCLSMLLVPFACFWAGGYIPRLQLIGEL
jgi:hypothetical protein